MKPYTFALRALACMFTGITLVQAQSPTPPPSKPPRHNLPTTQSDSSTELKRATAILLLTTLSEESKSYSDLALRTRVQARVADALWESDPDSAKELFLRAWQAAENAENEAAAGLTSKPGTAAGTRSLRLREEVLRIAARRDKELGEALLTRLTKERDERNSNLPTDSGNAVNHIDPTKPLPPGLSQRLALATQLLRDGDVERALGFAQPALAYPSIQGVAFLSTLREKREAAGDSQFAALATRSVADPLADANSVSVLSSYVFTPFLFVTTNRQGGAGITQLRGPTTPPQISAALRVSFLRQALNILLRPLPPTSQDRTTAGPAGTYIIIARLLPLYDQYASDLAPLLRTQLAALSQNQLDTSRPSLQEALTRGLTSNTDSLEESQKALDEIERLSSSDARDHAYANAAFRAAKRGDSSYPQLTDKISDSEMQQRARALADFAFVQYALDKKEAAAAVRAAKASNVTHIQRVWAFTEAANLVSKSDPIFALQLLDTALAEAERINVSDADHAYALVAIAARLVPLDKPRAWTMLSDAIKASNKAENFSASGGNVGEVVQSKSGILSMSFNAPSFSLSNALPHFVDDDPYRLIDLAKSINSQSARAAALIAIASAMLKNGDKNTR